MDRPRRRAALLVRLPLLTRTPASRQAMARSTSSSRTRCSTAKRPCEENEYLRPGYPVAILPALLAERVLGHGEAREVGAGEPGTCSGACTRWRCCSSARAILDGGSACGPACSRRSRRCSCDEDQTPPLRPVRGGALLAAKARFAAGTGAGCASGVAFGLSAYVKPAAQPMYRAAVALLLSTARGAPRPGSGQAARRRRECGTDRPLADSQRARRRPVGIKPQGGLTLFYRAFIGRPGECERTCMRQGDAVERGPSVAHHRCSSRVWCPTTCKN